MPLDSILFLVPIYEFYYAGETHCIAESTYSNFANPQIGEKREIYVACPFLFNMLEYFKI